MVNACMPVCKFRPYLSLKPLTHVVFMCSVLDTDYLCLISFLMQLLMMFSTLIPSYCLVSVSRFLVISVLLWAYLSLFIFFNLIPLFFLLVLFIYFFLYVAMKITGKLEAIAV